MHVAGRFVRDGSRKTGRFFVLLAAFRPEIVPRGRRRPAHHLRKRRRGCKSGLHSAARGGGGGLQRACMRPLGTLASLNNVASLGQVHTSHPQHHHDINFPYTSPACDTDLPPLAPPPCRRPHEARPVGHPPAGHGGCRRRPVQPHSCHHQRPGRPEGQVCVGQISCVRRATCLPATAVPL